MIVVRARAGTRLQCSRCAANHCYLVSDREWGDRHLCLRCLYEFYRGHVSVSPPPNQAEALGAGGDGSREP